MSGFDRYQITTKTIHSMGESWDESQMTKSKYGGYVKYDDVIQRIAELEAQVPKWISVDERLPEPETAVLAIVDGYDGILTVERRWEHCNPMIEAHYEDFLYWDWVDNDGQDFEGRVRYWMPILHHNSMKY